MAMIKKNEKKGEKKKHTHKYILLLLYILCTLYHV